MFHIWLLKESSLTQKHLLSFSNSTGSKGLSSNNNCWAVLMIFSMTSPSVSSHLAFNEMLVPMFIKTEDGIGKHS